MLTDSEIINCAQGEGMILPFVGVKCQAGALSYGLSPFGYDARLGSEIVEFVQNINVVDPFNNRIDTIHNRLVMNPTLGHELKPGDFILATTLETWKMPSRICGLVRDKSTLARLGLAVQNTVMEPGWTGELTLELSNHGPNTIILRPGMPIAQIQFFQGNYPDKTYSGKYQHQKGVTNAK